MTNRGKREALARQAWCKPEKLGLRVETPLGPGKLVSARHEFQGFGVALERGGWADFEALELIRSDEQY